LFAGGEFYYTERWFTDNPAVPAGDALFLNGGKACLIVIADYLRDHGIRSVLLPSYLCPTIIDTLESRGLSWQTYQVNHDLSIDPGDLDSKLCGQQAVYFINYFGFFHPEPAREHLAAIRRSGIPVIEDNAQGGFLDNPTGDFCFNSIRKLTPYDGGYLQTRLEVEPYVKNRMGLINRRLPLIRAYRTKLRSYLFEDADIYDELVRLHSLAEETYQSDPVVQGDIQEQQQIERLDWAAIKQIRRRNYAVMLDLIAGIPQLTPVFPGLQADNMPLGLPVTVSGVPRDWLLEELGNAGIGLTVHWDDIAADPRLNHNRTAVDMAGTMLTLVTDQYTSREQMQYLVQMITEAVRTHRIASRPAARWRGPTVVSTK
jgi:hypothetical protein